MSFRALVDGILIGIILPAFIVALTRQYSAKTRNYCYSFLSIAYLFLMVWFREDVEGTVGLALAAALWLTLWYSEVKGGSTKKRLVSSKETHSAKSSEIDNSLTSQKMKDSRVVFVTLLIWVFAFLGTCLPWKDYAYFDMVRIVAALIALTMIDISREISKPFLGGFILMIIIFNPFIHIKLNRQIWQVIDVSVILLLAFFYFTVKRKN